GLTVMTSGKSDDQAVQALAQPVLEETFRALREQYDFILVDSAPVLPIADSQLIGQRVDGVVFSILRGVSRLPVVYAGYERLALLRVRILGAIVNGMEGAGYSSAYHYPSRGGRPGGGTHPQAPKG